MPDTATRPCSAPNPHALPGALAASAKHAGRAIDHRWPMKRWRIAPGLAVLKAPLTPRYDLNGGPMVGDSAAPDAVDHLLGASSDIIVAHSVIAEGPAWEAIRRLDRSGRIALAVITPWERALLERSAAPDAAGYLATFVSNSQRKRLRRKRAALEEMGPLVLDIAQTAAEVAAGIEAFCALEAAGWKGRDGTALGQDAAGLAYVCDVMRGLVAEDAAFTTVLRAGEQPVAAGLFLRVGGEVVFWKTTYDEALAAHSPGVVFDVMLTEWLYGQPWFERLDAGHDDSVDPEGLIWKQRRRMANVVIDPKPGSWRGRTIVAVLRLRQALRRWKNRRQAAK